MISSEQALTRLREGNDRFVRHAAVVLDEIHYTSLADIERGQEPFAVILGCSDSRVPAEVVFDAGLGELFVVRVAGNIAAESQIGSIEYATAHLGTPLVVVLGHSHCGAITATLDAIQGASDGNSENIANIVEHIRPSVEAFVFDGGSGARDEDRASLIAKGVRENVRRTVSELTQMSEIIDRQVRSGSVRIVGAQYWLETGEVEFFNG
mgnify:CR=1 FL=1